MKFKPSNSDPVSARTTYSDNLAQKNNEIHNLEMKNASENASIKALRELDDRVRLRELKGHGGGGRIHSMMPRDEHDLKITDDRKFEEAMRNKVNRAPERSEEKKMRDDLSNLAISSGKPDTNTCIAGEKNSIPTRNSEGNFELTVCGPDGKTPALRKTFDYDAKTLIGMTQWDKSGSKSYEYKNGVKISYEHVSPNRDSEIINYDRDGKTPVSSQKIDHNGKISMTDYVDGKPQRAQTFQ